MPALEVADRYQKAVLMPATGGYDAYGQPVVGEAIEVTVRWVWEKQEVTDPQGNTITIDATAVVDREIPVHSRMWLGEIADWIGTGSGAVDNDLCEVRTASRTSDIKNRFVRRTVGLMRFRDQA
jgi:hypothetical protein